MTATADPILDRGTRLAHYEVESVLGSGAMGTVYLSRDTSLDRSVAVKVLRARLATEPAIVDRFVREARAAARVNHPNLTHIYFVGDEAGQRFFAMEYVPGTTFEQEIAKNGPMPLARFVDVIVQSARGLAAAHGAGVVHRDVKPSNLMLLPDGTVKVTDFGLAKSLGGDVDASGGGMLLGTPTYMSPEQCKGRGVDARTDVYALGLTAWFLLAGKPPYAGESLGQMLQDQMNTPLPSIRAVRPELPLALDQALAKLCEKDPEKRPKSMDEVAALFEPLRPRPLELATFMARAVASCIDGAIVITVLLFVALLKVAVEQQINLRLIPEIVVAIIGAATLLASQLGFEVWLGRSIGKWLFNLEVVRSDGAVPTRRALAARFLIRYPVFVAVLWPDSPDWVDASVGVLQGFALLLAACSFAAYRGRTLSDLITHTRVVYRRTDG
jgi:serine/threonine protein kinase